MDFEIGDIILEILVHLRDVDILQLTRTSRCCHTSVIAHGSSLWMRRVSAFLRKDVHKIFEIPPDSPTFRVLLEPHDWRLTYRLLTTCPEALHHVPHTTTSEIYTWIASYHGVPMVFNADQIHRLILSTAASGHLIAHKIMRTAWESLPVNSRYSLRDDIIYAPIINGHLHVLEYIRSIQSPNYDRFAHLTLESVCGYAKRVGCTNISIRGLEYYLMNSPSERHVFYSNSSLVRERIEHGDYGTVKLLIKHKIIISPFQNICQYGRHEGVLENELARIGDAFYIAAQMGNAQILRLLMKMGDPRSSEHFSKYIHAACLSGRVDCVSLLLSTSSQPPRTGETCGVSDLGPCVKLCAIRGYADILDVLLRYVRIRTRDSEPIRIAVHNNHTAVFVLLMTRVMYRPEAGEYADLIEIARFNDNAKILRSLQCNY